MKAKVTRWFDGDINPVRVGSYETRQDEDDRQCGFQYWDGKSWGFWGHTAKDAFRCRLSKSQWQRPQWRGLAKKP